MTEPRFDFDAVFDADYLHFYAPRIGADATRAEADLIWRLLQLRRGMRLLDLGCGHGRMSLALAARGCRVTGLDASAYFLTRARRAARAQRLAVDFVRGDMRELAYAGTFARALSWFTAFGYYDDATDRAVLRAVHRALAPGGVFLLDHLNRDWVLRNFQQVKLLERGRDMLIDRNAFDPVSGRLSCHRTVWRRGKRRDMHYAVRLFTAPELRDWLRDAGFAQVEAYDSEQASYDLASDRMLLVARRA